MATFKTPITFDGVPDSRMIAYPFRLLRRCSVTRMGWCLDPSCGRAREGPPAKPVYLIDTGESVENDGEPNGEFYLLARLSRRWPNRLSRGPHHPQRRRSSNDLLIYDAPCSLPGASFVHLPIYDFEDLGFVPRGEAGAFIAGHNTAPGGKLPLNTNGGGLSYMHSDMYGMYAVRESVRRIRSTAPAEICGAKVSVCHGVGGLFVASGTSIMINQGP